MRKNKSTVDTIKGYSFFKPGWDFGEGKSFSHEVIEKAIGLVERGEAYGFLTEAFPEAVGAITVSFVNGSYCLDISVNFDLTFDVQYEFGVGDEYRVLTQVDNIQESELEAWFLKLQIKT